MYSIYQTKDLKCFVFPKGFDIVKVNPDNCLVIKTENNTIIADLLVNKDVLNSLLNFNCLVLNNACFIYNKETYLKKPVCVICKDKLNYLTKNCSCYNTYLCDKLKPQDLKPFSLDLSKEKFIPAYLINKDIGKVKVNDLSRLAFEPKLIKENKDLLKKRYEFSKSQKEKNCKGCVLACKKKLSELNCYISKERLDKFLDKKIKQRFGSKEKFLNLLSYCSRVKDVVVLNHYADNTNTRVLLPIKKDELILFGKLPKGYGNNFYRQNIDKLKPRHRKFKNISTARLIMLLLFLFQEEELLDPKKPYRQKGALFKEWQYLYNYHLFDQFFDRRYFRLDFALKDENSLWVDFYHNLGFVKEITQEITDYQGLFRILPKPVYLDKFLTAVIDKRKTNEPARKN